MVFIEIYVKSQSIKSSAASLGIEFRHRLSYHLGGVFWYGSSISIIIYLSLIRGISSVVDGEN